MCIDMSEEKIKPVPKCIGIIIDGNRRWAKEQGVSAAGGHKAGYETLKKFVGWARDAGVQHVVAYVFSTENWNRSPKEVKGLMNLTRFVLKHELGWFKKEDVRVQIVGDRKRLDGDIQKMIESVEDETKDMDSIHLVLALSYGGRAELVAAAKTLVDRGDKNVTEASFLNALWTSSVPEVDMIIRTGGELRLSNFLPWQSAYSELFFTDTLWPAYTKEEFMNMIEVFATRERRHGR